MHDVTETILPLTQTEPMQILLPHGLIGLGEVREFALESVNGSWPLMNLRSQGELEIEFYVVEAHDVVAGYVLELSDEDAQDLDLTCAEDALVINLVTVHSHRPQFVTVNLAGPIVVNRRTLLGKQIVLPSDRFSTVHPLIDERPKRRSILQFPTN